jgi:hypothetical protein
MRAQAPGIRFNARWPVRGPQVLPAVLAEAQVGEPAAVTTS